MQTQRVRTHVLPLLRRWLTAASRALFVIGFIQIYVTACRPSIVAFAGPVGLALCVAAAGVAALQASLVRQAKNWITFVALILLAAFMVFGLYVLVLRCSGV